MSKLLKITCLISTVALAQEGRLAFSAYDADAGRHLPYTYDLETDDLREVPLPVEADCGDLALIYDGSRVAVELTVDGEEMLYVRPTRTGEVAAHRAPFPGAEPSWIEYTTLCYTIDGDLWHWNGVTDPLDWLDNVGLWPVQGDWLTVYYVSLAVAEWTVVERNVNTGEQEVLLVRMDPIREPDVSPDGTRLAVAVGNDVILVDLTGGERPRNLALPTDARPCYPSFSPDGEWVAYYDAGVGAVMAAPVEGGDPVKLRDLEDCRGLDWGPTPEDW
ncbi:MAG: hypothetical protein A2Y64_01735 [Candidatus Coatesbacteria bacterium RBG_13_66_14]|uniref:Dipeptidylpeptidase IV N-terminal domain-containing protein n=1 Tax=Candidatus Coatesbacteria bacterium RBG_13_66_14 TaxID=1817816 RepID=A0A1F5F4A8_9BACT|nr:MAG: hypothetical protein A2Y64_01735 [Candidatus Coatesbacteria bacterium RBG_13_66_14]